MKHKKSTKNKKIKSHRARERKKRMQGNKDKDADGIHKKRGRKGKAYRGYGR